MRSNQNRGESKKIKFLDILKKISLVGLISITALGVIFYGRPEYIDKWNQKLAAFKKKRQEQKKKQKLLQKYGNQKFEIEPYYAKENSMVQKFRPVLQNPTNDGFLHFFPGMFGQGKSSALQFLTQELRKQGKRIFYCNLRIDKGSKGIVNRETISQLPALMDAVAQEFNKNPKQPLIFIIDDINKLEHNGEPVPSNIEQIYSMLLELPSTRGLNVYLILNSSFYCTKKKKIQSFAKKSKFNIIQPQNNETERKRQIRKILGYYRGSYQKQEVDYFILSKWVTVLGKLCASLGGKNNAMIFDSIEWQNQFRNKHSIPI